MPNMDGTGPNGAGFGRRRWMPGRTSGWSCWRYPNQQNISSSQETIPVTAGTPVYGMGRGGLPRGCGRRFGRNMKWGGEQQ